MWIGEDGVGIEGVRVEFGVVLVEIEDGVGGKECGEMCVECGGVGEIFGVG